MNLKNYRPLVELAISAIPIFIVHQSVLYFLGVNTKSFSFSIPALYATFFGVAILIISVLIFVKQKSVDSVGSTLMLLTCLKMVPAFMIISPAIKSNQQNPAFEKTNFLIIFGVFLIIETVIAIRLLNRK